MNNKKWTLFVLGITGLLLLITIVLVYVVDPLFQYRAPKENGYLITNEYYHNAGIAKSYDYDAVILGSSMCENFKVTEFNEKYNVTTVKLTYGGAYALNFKTIMDVVKDNVNVKKVFWGVDVYAFTKPSDQTRYPLPEYLYDNKLLNDFKYVLNKDIIIDSFFTLYNQLKGIPTTSLDDCYNWFSKEKNSFIPSKVIQEYMDTKKVVKKVNPSSNEYLDMAKINMVENIIPIIEDNENTEFYLFYPPYSILYWDYTEARGELDAYFEVLEYITEVFLQYDNVSLYTFQDIDKIVCDISLYKDYSHYHSDINSFIVDNLDNSDYKIKKDNYLDKITSLRNLIADTNLDELIDFYSQQK